MTATIDINLFFFVWFYCFRAVYGTSIHGREYAAKAAGISNLFVTSTLKDNIDALTLQQEASFSTIGLQALKNIEVNVENIFLRIKKINGYFKAKELEKFLLPKLKNWEIDRIAGTDHILLKMALVENSAAPASARA